MNPTPAFPDAAAARTAAALLALCAAVPPAHAADACLVTDLGASPGGCMATPSWSGTGEYEPAIIRVMSGGQYTRGAGLYIANSNTAAPPGGNSGTRGIYAYGQSSAPTPVPSQVTIAGYTPVTIAVTNVFNPTSNEGVYAAAGAQMHFGAGLNITTQTSLPAQQARALVADGIGVGALAGSASFITVAGLLEADTTLAPATPFAVQASDGGQITAQAGGIIKSAGSGIYLRNTGVGSNGSRFFSSSTSVLTLQAAGNGVTLEGQGSGNANWGAVQLNHAAITAHDSGVHLHSGNSPSSFVSYRQENGSITSTQGSALVFSGGQGTAVATLLGTTVATTSPVLGGMDADGQPIGYAVASTSNASNTLNMTGGSLGGPIVTDSGARLWLQAAGTQWNTGGDPASANVNTLTGISGTATIRMDDINDQITLRGDTPGLGTGCGDASLTLVVPAQPAPAASPHLLMQCNNAAAAPTMALQGGSVVLGGFSYTLQTAAADGRVNYQLVRGAAAPVGAGGGATSIPTLSEWGLWLLSGLVGLAALRRRHGRG